MSETDRESRVAANELLFRSVNERINELGQLWQSESFEIVCECGDGGCFERIDVTTDDYESVREQPRRFMVRAGHEQRELEDVVATHDAYVVVEKPATPEQLAGSGGAVSARRIAENEARFRSANEQIEESADRLGLGDERLPFLCECADLRCTAVIRLSRDEYEEVRSDARLFAVLPGHEASSRSFGAVVERRPGYFLLRKLGEAAEVAEELDPRS